MMLRLALAVVLAVSAMASDAQSGRRDGRGQVSRERPMSQEDRQRMRDDVRDAYRRDERKQQPSRQQQMSPEERGRLRRDIEDANRELKR